MKRWIIGILVVLSLLLWFAVVWFALPLVGFGEATPFEPIWVRILMIAVVWLTVGIVSWSCGSQVECRPDPARESSGKQLPPASVGRAAGMSWRQPPERAPLCCVSGVDAVSGGVPLVW